MKPKLALLAVASACSLCLPAQAADAGKDFDTGAANLLAVVRESPGANKPDEALRPVGPIQARLADGREVTFEASWFNYLGDLHLRLVFDGERRVQSVVPDDLARLHLSPEQALDRAVQNLRERYGPAEAMPWSGQLMQVQGRAAELNSSFLLDRQFWLQQLARHPDGIVVAVPSRGGLVFAPAADEAALLSLRFSAAALYAANDRDRVSSALYLFKAGRWSVFQAAQPVVASDR